MIRSSYRFTDSTEIHSLYIDKLLCAVTCNRIETFARKCNKHASEVRIAVFVKI